jgi:hypothetical protein
VLKRGGYPDDFANSLALDLWAQSEGMPADWFNWLAYTGHTAGCSAPALLPDNSLNSDHVDRCPAHIAGVLNTVAMLGNQYFTHVDYFMRQPYSKDKLDQIYLAINQSAACPHCQKGHYPQVLYYYLQGHGAPPPLVDQARAAAPKEKKVPRPVTLLNGWGALMKALSHSAPYQLKRSRVSRAEMLTVVKYRAKRPRRP